MFLFWSRDADGYRKDDRKCAVVWPWLVLELCTVLALTQLRIWQSDWQRVGIRSTNLHIVVECRNWPRFCVRSCGWTCHYAHIGRTVSLLKPPQSLHYYLGAVDHAKNFPPTPGHMASPVLSRWSGHSDPIVLKLLILLRCVTDIKFAQNLRWLGNWH